MNLEDSLIYFFFHGNCVSIRRLPHISLTGDVTPPDGGDEKNPGIEVCIFQ